MPENSRPETSTLLDELNRKLSARYPVTTVLVNNHFHLVLYAEEYAIGKTKTEPRILVSPKGNLFTRVHTEPRYPIASIDSVTFNGGNISVATVAPNVVGFDPSDKDSYPPDGLIVLACPVGREKEMWRATGTSATTQDTPQIQCQDIADPSKTASFTPPEIHAVVVTLLNKDEAERLRT